MNNEILGYYDGKFMLGNHELKSFDIVPNSFLDMQQMEEMNKVKIQLFNIESNTISNDSNVSFEIEHFIKNEAFLLVFGGWIPCTFIKKNTILLADRNVISEIIRRYKNGIKKADEPLDSFDNIFLNNNNIKLDISPFVVEGNEQRIPTYSMIDKEIDNAIKDIKSALPSLEIATYPNGNTYYYQIKDKLKPIIEKRINFLQNIAPKLNKQFSKKTREKAIEIILKSAEETELEKNDIVIILVMLRVLMKGNKTAAQLVLKDSQTYSETNAYNATFDLSTIEMLINLHIFHENNTDYNIALITKDKGLSLFSSLFNNMKVSKRNLGKIQIDAKILYSVFSDNEELLETYQKWLKNE